MSRDWWYRVPRAAPTEDWEPTATLDVFPAESLLTLPIAVNQQDRVAWFVIRKPLRREVGELRTAEEVVHHLYVI